MKTLKSSPKKTVTPKPIAKTLAAKKTVVPTKPATAKKTTKKASPKTAAPKAAALTKMVAKAAPPAPASVLPLRPEISTEEIATRAYLLWEQRGCPHGRDVELWVEAESQLKLSPYFSA